MVKNDKDFFRACPFCATQDLWVDAFGITDDNNPTDFRVMHIEEEGPCDVWGPEAPTREGAIRLWNRRAPEIVL